MLHATSCDSCTRTALQSPQPHHPPAFWPVLRHARDDASCTTASRASWGLGVPRFNAWLMRRLISAARRLLSSPATRAHLGHSAQAFWAGSKSWHNFCAVHMLCDRVAARAAEMLLVTHFLLAHVRVLCSKVDGSMTLDELHRTMWFRHTADGRPRRELGKTARLTLFV